jgi:peptidyl-prolyl cis-trans isomerase D
LAQKLGLKIFDLPPIYQDGRTLDPNLNMQQFPEILKSVFSLSQGAESGIESMGQGQFFAVKILKVKPAGVLSFDTVKAQLPPLYMQKTYLDSLKQTADQAYARLNKGEPIDKVAASLKAELITINGVDMKNAQQKLGDQGLARAVFSTKAKANFTALAQGGMFVGRIDAIKDASPQEINALTGQMRPQQAQRITGDLGMIVSMSARKDIKLKTHPEVVLKALDIKPDTSAASSSSKAK